VLVSVLLGLWIRINMESYDMVVIGGGPGGSGAAYYGAKAGLRVLMIEKRQEIGSPKRCGEGLSEAGLERMGLELDRVFVRKDIAGAAVYTPDGKCVKVDYGGAAGWVIERKILDKWLAEHASEQGARILAKTEAVEVIKEDGIVSGVKLKSDGREWEVKTPLVIAADGIESRIAKTMGINTTLKTSDVISGYQYEMSNIDINTELLELFFGTEIAPGGYIWIFPKGKRTANVGIGVRRPYSKKPAKEYLDAFIESREGLKNGSIIEVNSGAVPVGGFLKTMVSQGLIVVGDAAHQVNPIHGGGIAESFVGGRIAAGVVAEAKKAGDFSEEFLERYNDRWFEERGNKLKKILVLREVVEKLSDDDMNWLAEHLSGENLVSFSKSSGFGMLAKLLMRKPKLIMLARKLL